MKDSVIKDIGRDIVWLEQNAESDNILLISSKMATLNTRASTLAADVYKAYALMNESEDRYKAAVDEFITNFDGSVAKAEPAARTAHVELKKEWTTAKNIYKKLDMILDRIDKISDTFKQRVSVVKQSNLKNL